MMIRKVLFVVAASVVCSFLATMTFAGEIALTFDDAPRGKQHYLSGMERTEMLISKLDSLGVEQVAFFCKTDQIEFHNGRKRLEMYADAGHLLANHSHLHRHPDIIGATAYIEDIKRAHELLSSFDQFRKWFRYPFLDEGRTIPIRDSIRAALADMGYLNAYVTVDNYDWYLERKFQLAQKEGKQVDFGSLRETYVSLLWEAIQFYDQAAIKVFGRSPKHVLLLHENDLAALFIDDLVSHIRANGWEIISPEKAYQDPIVSHSPDVLFNNQGRVAAIAHERGISRRDLVHRAEDVKYLDSIFEAREIFE